MNLSTKPCTPKPDCPWLLVNALPYSHKTDALPKSRTYALPLPELQNYKNGLKNRLKYPSALHYTPTSNSCNEKTNTSSLHSPTKLHPLTSNSPRLMNESKPT
ncbi:hypothetical protein KC19_VG017600 [Ceratodon purpureus]|uniref:Uncharacterized protein n=1 Tax=Ceratodon purpureus TaxID=3225 RepID=A0A8T0HL89_CERPU|nr:hypothetical protein KC19_VG017600 [Ceratodon purpureus]